MQFDIVGQMVLTSVALRRPRYRSTLRSPTIDSPLSILRQPAMSRCAMRMERSGSSSTVRSITSRNCARPLSHAVIAFIHAPMPKSSYISMRNPAPHALRSSTAYLPLRSWISNATFCFSPVIPSASSLFFTPPAVDHFLFGSEIKALLASSILTPAPDWQAISDFFTFLYVPGPRTAFDGIQQLPPAHSLTLHLKDNSISLARYWDVARREDLESTPYAELKSQIQQTLAEAVNRQLVSDVPLGVFLSGGIDSTIVAGLAKREKKDIQTYTLAIAGEEYRFFDEAEKARSVSRHLGTEHFELSLEFPDLFEFLNVVELFDQPFANPTSYLMRQLAQKAREHITVALCGAGGDELFAGYPRASAVRMARRIGWIPRPFLRFGANALSMLRDSHQTPYLRRARKFFGGLDSDFFVQYANWTYFLNEDQKRRLIHGDLRGASSGNNLHSSVDALRSAYAQSALRDQDNRILQMDLKTFLVDNILEYTDRMSMAMALEVRVPLLDTAFVEMSLNTPFAYKYRNGETKAILIDAFAEFFPPGARHAPKRGFNAPLALWTGKLFDPYFDASLVRSHPLRRRLGDDIGAAWNDGILDLIFIQQLRLQHRQGTRDNSHELFACILFDVWWRKYIKKSHLVAQSQMVEN